MQVSGMKERMGECGGSPVSQRQGFLAKRGTIQNAVEGSYTTLFDQEVQQELLCVRMPDGGRRWRCWCSDRLVLVKETT